MRWPAKPIPEEGDMRTVRCFALLPVRIASKDDQRLNIWLEHYLELQEYKFQGDSSYGWECIRAATLPQQTTDMSPSNRTFWGLK